MDILTKTAMGFVAAMLAMTIGQLHKGPNEVPRLAETAFIAPYNPVTAPPVPTTRPVIKTTNCAQVGVLAVAAGLPTSELGTAVKVARRESRCWSDAHNKADTVGQSYGVWQINDFWCRPSTYWPTGWLQAKGILDTCEQLLDPQINAAAMVAIWRNSGWLPWATAK